MRMERKWLYVFLLAIGASGSCLGAEPAVSSEKDSGVIPPEVVNFLSATSNGAVPGTTASYLEVAVAQNGSFTCGVPDGAALLHGHPNPWSSGVTVQIDGKNYSNAGKKAPKLGAPVGVPSVNGANYEGSWDTGDVRITQSLSIVNGNSGNPDLLKVSYTLLNQGPAAHEVGVRILLDTQLAGNDGTTFQLPDGTQVTTEKEYSGSAVPTQWETASSLSNPDTLKTRAVLLDNGVLPDRLVLANTAQMLADPWAVVVDPAKELTDSAAGIYWNPAALAPGQSTTKTLYYGLDGLVVTAGLGAASDDSSKVKPLASALSVAASLSSTSNPSAPSQSVKFTAVVTPKPPAAGTPTGSVAFKIDGKPEKTVSLSNGKASFTTTFAVVGSYKILAEYSGDAHFAPSKGELTQEVVSGPPDLKITGFTTSMDSSASMIQNIHVKATIKNLGGEASKAVPLGVRFYLSKDGMIDPSADMDLNSSCNLPRLMVGGQFDCSGKAVLPFACVKPTSTTPASQTMTYYVGVYVDPEQQISGETNRTNNSAVASSSITCSNTPPDLDVVKVMGPATGVIGDDIQVSAKVRNTGSVGVDKKFRVEYFLSKTHGAAFDSAQDIDTGWGCDINRLAAGAVVVCGGKLNISRAVLAGTYYLGVYVDKGHKVTSEVETGNNWQTSQDPIVLTGCVSPMASGAGCAMSK
ncbi:exported hypothetical protein [Gammaproteobacteria bacterium]